MEKTIKSLAINQGVYLGILLTIVTVLAYVIDLGFLTKWWVGILLFIVVLTFGIVSASKAKTLLSGFISFKQVFSSYFITIAVGILISTVVSILLFNIIDPEAAEIMKEKIIESSSQMMEKFGAPQSEIDKAINKMQEQNQFAIGNQLKSVAYQLVFFSVIGLIIALVMKSKNPDEA
jgi:uncharacterized membrane protein (DUF106 family)